MNTARRSSWLGSFWGGSIRSVSAALVAVSCLAAVAPAVRGQEAPATRQEAASRTADLRIGLPAGEPPAIAIAFGEGGLKLDLPRGAVFPLDFVAASGGLVRKGEVVSLGADRLRLELLLSGGLLDAVTYDASGIVLKFRRRAQAVAEGGIDEAASYKLGPDDKIQITINGHPEYTRPVVVGGNGSISAPLVGDIAAGGRTPREVSALLTELLARDYLVDPQVDVEVLEYKSKWVMVAGEVKSPSRLPLRGGSTLKDVLSDAGGFTADAGETITISRQNPEGGEATVLTVSRLAFEAGEANPTLVPGDIVNVKSATYVYLRGEVRNPNRVRIERGMTLLRALAIVGDLTEWADRKAVVVLREDGAVPAEEYNLKEIERGKTADPVLTGGEIVIVKRRFL